MINWIKQRLPKISGWRLGAYLAFSATCSCSHGLKIDSYVVDASNGGYQGVSEEKGQDFYVSFEEAPALLCAESANLEALLKACQKHEILAITFCAHENDTFLCRRPDNSIYIISDDEADNYFCMTPKDKERILDRCQ